jgi:hypothetical protein
VSSGIESYIGSSQLRCSCRIGFISALLANDPGGGIPVGNGRFLPLECEFYNGDDLSENAYRMARRSAATPVRMRFGYDALVSPVDRNDPRNAEKWHRFRLAHLVATNCCNAIVNPPIINWGLVSGEAAE